MTTIKLNDYIAVNDFETTGFSGNIMKIIQIGAEKYRNGKEVTVLNALPNRSFQFHGRLHSSQAFRLKWLWGAAN